MLFEPSKPYDLEAFTKVSTKHLFPRLGEKLTRRNSRRWKETSWHTLLDAIVSLTWILFISVADTKLAPEEQRARTLDPDDTTPSALLEVNNHPTSSSPDLSNNALPHSNLPTTTPPAVLREKRKRKSRHKTKKPCKTQKKFIASDDEEASEGSLSDTDSAHSSHGNGNDNNTEPHQHYWERPV